MPNAEVVHDAPHRPQPTPPNLGPEHAPDFFVSVEPNTASNLERESNNFEEAVERVIIHAGLLSFTRPRQERQGPEQETEPEVLSRAQSAAHRKRDTGPETQIQNHQTQPERHLLLTVRQRARNCAADYSSTLDFRLAAGYR